MYRKKQYEMTPGADLSHPPTHNFSPKLDPLMAVHEAQDDPDLAKMTPPNLISGRRTEKRGAKHSILYFAVQNTPPQPQNQAPESPNPGRTSPIQGTKTGTAKTKETSYNEPRNNTPKMALKKS